VASERHVVGFDVVELMPNQYNKAPDFIAAKLVYKFLSYIFYEPLETINGSILTIYFDISSKRKPLRQGDVRDG